MSNKTITLSTDDLSKMIAEATAAGVAAALAQIAAPVDLAEVAVPKEDGRNKAARAHNHQARMDRREQAGARGLTKAEKSALYGLLTPKGNTGKPSAASWTRIVADYKAAEKATGITVAEFCAAF